MPEHRFIIHGDATPEQKEDHSKWVEGWFEQSTHPIEGELEKTPEDVRLIDLINEDIKANFAELGLANAPTVLPEQVHLLNPEGYAAVAHEDDGLGFQSAGAVYISRSAFTSTALLVDVVVHEVYHLISARKFITGKEGTALAEYRMGYKVKPLSPDKKFKPFLGLNEAVTEQSAIEFMDRNRESLISDLHAMPEDLDLGYADYAYPTSRAILDDLIPKVAAYRKEAPFTTWQRFERGIYSGDMMHLRDIARAFDTRTFQLISMAGNPLGKLTFQDVNTKVLAFLRSTDQAFKNQIYAELEAARDGTQGSLES